MNTKNGDAKESKVDSGFVQYLKQPRHTLPSRMRISMLNQRNRMMERLASAPSMQELNAANA